MNNKINMNLTKKRNGPLNLFKGLFAILGILLILLLTLKFIPKKDKFLIKYRFDEISINSSLNTKEDYTNFVNKLKNNNKVSNDYKNVYISLFEKEYNENYLYINLEEIANKVNSCNFVINNGLYSKNKNVAGFYSTLFNEINFYDVEDFNSIDIGIFYHEFNHLVSNYSVTNKFQNIFLVENPNENILAEGYNELFSREYLEEYEDDNSVSLYKSYNKYIPYIYLFSEILDDKTIRMYKFNNNESIIINELLNIDNNENEAYILIQSFNNIIGLENLLNSNNDEYLMSKEYLKENIINFKKAYSYFFEKKYGYEASGDLECSIYYSMLGIVEEVEEETLLNGLKISDLDLINEVIPKGYVSNYSKEKHKDIVVKICDKNGLTEFRINEENRKIEEN